MPSYEVHQGDIMEWASEYAGAARKGDRPLYHGAFGDPPYLLSFMGDGMRDAPHRLYARENPGQVNQVANMLGLQPWEAAAVMWYRDVFKLIDACLHPGSPVLMCAGPRTDDLMAIGMRAAGLDVRTKLMYMYGSGMPHGLNLEAEAGPEWAGYGTEFKPAYETLIYATKPIPGTYARAAAMFGTVGINVDGARIDRGDGASWPANVLLQHAEGCGDDYCVRGCPIALLDEQSGESTSRRSKRGNMVRAPGDSYGAGHAELPDTNTERGYNDAGGASRFFYTSKVAPWEREAGLDGQRVYLQARVNPGGLENEPRFAPKATTNPHPTMKSIRALIYLLRAIGRPAHVEGRLLVPFAGTGSEMIAAGLAGNWSWITGVELDQDDRYPGAFVPIARKRIEWWAQFRRYEDARRAAVGEQRYRRRIAAAKDVGQLSLFT